MSVQQPHEQGRRPGQEGGVRGASRPAATRLQKLRISASPYAVATLSGWNCTPYSGSSRCASAISTRSAPGSAHGERGRAPGSSHAGSAWCLPHVQASACRHAGRLASATASEW